SVARRDMVDDGAVTDLLDVELFGPAFLRHSKISCRSFTLNSLPDKMGLTMTVESHVVRLATQKEGEILDITDKVQTIVENGTISNGVVFLFVPGSDRKSTRLNSSHDQISYAVFCL